MAGSYKHVVDDQGRLLDNEQVAGMLETGGDVYEAVEEMYGMIWWLATHLSECQWPQEPPRDGHQAQAARNVERARERYEKGLDLSPGLREGQRVSDKVRLLLGQHHLPVCPHDQCQESGVHGHGTDIRYRPRSRL